MKAVILAGGYGKRLRPLTNKVPKPLVEVAGKPILRWQIEWLRMHGFREVVLCVGYLKEKIMEYVGDGGVLGVKAYYAVEDEPLGTGGAIKNAESVLQSEGKFLVLNGDVLTNLNPARLVDALGGAAGALSLVPLRSSYGVIDVDERGVIREFREKPLLPDYWINAGVYCFTPEILNHLPERGDIESTSFPELARRGRLVGVKYNDVYWRSIDTYKDLEVAERELPRVRWR